MSIEDIHIIVSSDSSIAILDEFSEGTTKTEVIQALHAMGIVNGIDEAKINAILFGEKTVDSIIVKTPSLLKAVTIAEREPCSINEAITVFSNTYSLYQSGSLSSMYPFSLFVEKENTFCEIQILNNLKNIFNKPLIEEDMRKILSVDSSTVKVSEVNNTLKYSALEDGYPAIDREGNLTIIPAFVSTEDKMELSVKIIPLQSGANRLLVNIQQRVQTFSEKIGREIPQPIEIDLFENIQESREVKSVKLYEGIPPLHGTDGVLIKHIEEKKKAEANESGTVNMKEFTSYREVVKGEIIVEKIAPTIPKNGIDVFGTELVASAGKEVNYQAGLNVITEEKVDRTIFKAGITGVIHFKKTSVDITEDLSIKGDAGIQTGNIVFSKDITISGDVCSGYTIECGGNITIGGDVEDKVTIKCEGNICIKNGVFGKNTFIEAAGDVRTGFIQEASLHVGGNLEVDSYILNADILCQQALTVIGNHIDKEKTAVIGGTIIAMHNIRAHSMGSYSNKTTIYCGFNPTYYEKEVEIRQAIKQLDALLIKIQNSIGFNLHDRHNIKRLAILSEKERNSIKEKLKKLKEVSDRKELLQKGLDKVHALVYNEDTENIFVLIDKNIIPDITLRIGREVEAIKKEMNSIKFYLHDREIHHIDSKWEKS